MKNFYYEFRKKFLRLRKYPPQGIIAVVDGVAWDYTAATREVKKNNPCGEKILAAFFGNGGRKRKRKQKPPNRLDD